MQTQQALQDLLQKVELLKQLHMQECVLSSNIEMDRYVKMKELLLEIERDAGECDKDESTVGNSGLSRAAAESSIIELDEKIQNLHIDDSIGENFTGVGAVPTHEVVTEKTPLNDLRKRKCICLYRCQCTKPPPRRICDMENLLYYYILPQNRLPDVINKYGGPSQCALLSFTAGLVDVLDLEAKLVRIGSWV
uniref:Protein BNI1 n=1 Tax=Lygus hesperus TaxID=30085 RepID=A0A0A9YCX8_LYGHE